MSWMLYGANGYTGRMVARIAARRGERPVLAGRTAAKIEPLATELGLPHRVVDLDDATALRQALDGVSVVAHCAGPFSATAAPMVSACLATGTHYLDITGEIDVFEAIYARDREARDAGVVLLPGAGFDVVPTDCLAASLARALPGATELDLAFTARMRVGPGTAKTALEGAALGGRARVAGSLRQVSIAHRSVTAEFPSGPRVVHAIPWGDLSSAYRSTGIGTITTYTALPGGGAAGSGYRLLAPVLRMPAVQRVGAALVDRVMGAASPPEGLAGGAEVWGQVCAPGGLRASGTITMPAPIPFTADSVVRIASRLAAGGTEPGAGAHTPATAFGPDFVRECDGVSMQLTSGDDG